MTPEARQWLELTFINFTAVLFPYDISNMYFCYFVAELSAILFPIRAYLHMLYGYLLIFAQPIYS